MSTDRNPMMAILRAKVAETARLWQQHQGAKSAAMSALITKHMREKAQ